MPSKGLLRMPTLTLIKRASWSEACSNCSLLKETDAMSNNPRNAEIDRLRKGEYVIGKSHHCRGNRHTVSVRMRELAKYGFFPSCFDNNSSKCFTSEVNVTPIHRCWDSDNHILNLEYLVCPVAVILNIVVFVTILSTPSLRESVCLLLTANMAFSDLLISTYTLILVSARKMSYLAFLKIMNDLCRVLGFMWLTGQIVTVLTSVLLTIERYMGVTNCMNPSLHIRQGTAVKLMLASWVLAFAIASLPYFGIGAYNGNTFCVPLKPSRDIPHLFEMSVVFAAIAIVLYAATIPVYVKIYLYVRKSGEEAGVRREGTLAKNIALLVTSNMVFFVVPCVIAMLWLVTNLAHSMSPVTKEILTGALPTLCFSVNSCVNPLLCAFRGEKFKNALKQKLGKWLTKGKNISPNTLPSLDRLQTASAAQLGLTSRNSFDVMSWRNENGRLSVVSQI